MVSIELAGNMNQLVQDVTGEGESSLVNWRYRFHRCREDWRIRCIVAETKLYEKANPSHSRLVFVFGLEAPLGIAATLAEPGEESHAVMGRLIDTQCSEKCREGCIYRL